MNFSYGNRILLNNYDTLYYINESSGNIISFTINGLKIFKKTIKSEENNNNKNSFSSYLINIYDEFRFLYCDIVKNQIIEFNPTNLDEIFFTYDLKEIKTDDKEEIISLFYNEKTKSFDIWIKKENNIEIKNYELKEQFDNITLKDNYISKESTVQTSSKKLKMEKFAQNIFKTTISFSTSKKNK